MESNDAILVGMGLLCAQVAHDMRSPLACICAGLGALSDPDRGPDERAQLLKILGVCTEKLNRMAAELLEYRSADQICLAPTNVLTMINSVCDEVRLQAHAKGVALEWTCSTSSQRLLDECKMGRVLQNLIQNAIHAAKGSAQPMVTVAVALEGPALVIRVSDTGSGLPKDHLHKLFKESFTTKGRLGNGLGLTYCHAVVQGHHGTIAAYNRPEGGAEFVITLPK